ncbi:Variant SH3 [Penicillium cf. griseofulvum]|nr:Variant SH3 [Penicillium cf. griseofulvum]
MAQLPARFPCWCRAVYSWGGETTRDLGFVEGDLIECLNAGDGQWWMGRLRRDRRAVGLFPSNFVELLSEDFVPVSRDTTSPMVLAGSSPINNPTSAPKKQKTVWRKPFQAHKEAVSPASVARRATQSSPAAPAIPPNTTSGWQHSTKLEAITHACDSSQEPRLAIPTPINLIATLVARCLSSVSSSRPSSRDQSPLQSQERSYAMTSKGSTSSTRPLSRNPSPLPIHEHSSGMVTQGSTSSYRASSREPSPLQMQDYPPPTMPHESIPSYRGSSREPSPLQMQEYPPSTIPHGSISSYQASSREPSPMYIMDHPPPTMPHGSMSSYRDPSPLPMQDHSSAMVPYGRIPSHRAPSPLPMQEHSTMISHDNMYRAPSRGPSPVYMDDRPPAPMPHRSMSSYRAPSPLPVQEHPAALVSQGSMAPYRVSSREPSPVHMHEEQEDSPPPPPPPHRVVIGARSRSPQPPMHSQARSHSPLPPMHSSQHRAHSPQPPMHSATRSHSPLPPAHSSRHRAHSPNPPSHHPELSRSSTPLVMNDRYTIFNRTPSPSAASMHSAVSATSAQSDIHGNTPSPLRDAMEDVMSSLEDMGLPRQDQSPSPSPVFNNPWAPEEFDPSQERTPQGNRRRALTSMGFDGDKEQPHGGLVHRNSVYSHEQMDGPPQLNNYVQRMESRLRQLENQNRPSEDRRAGQDDDDNAPPPPPKHATYHPRNNSIPGQYAPLKARRSGHDLRGDILNRSFTNKSSATNSSSGVQSNGTSMTTSTDKTSQSVMSGFSAGGFSATSAGSFARRGGHERPNTAMDTVRSRGFSDVRPETPFTGVSYHSSHNSSRQGASSAIPWSSTGLDSTDHSGVFGGLTTPKSKKQGFFKKIFETAKTGAASARSSISVGYGDRSNSPTKSNRGIDVVSPALMSHSNRDSGRDMAPGTGSIDWVQVRRDVNRASSPSRNERIDRAERCQMMDHPVIYSVEELYDTAEGDESIDGQPITEPTNFNAANLTLVDKSARFISSLPPMTNPMSLAQAYICRPYKSDVQRLRAIFTWVSEKIAWEEPVDGIEVDMKRLLQAKRGTPEEIALLVHEMCAAVGLHTEIIRGFLKSPGDVLDLESLSHPNHWWNSVLVDGEWRFMDCALANPTNPQRSKFVSNNSSVAESWYFLTRPLDLCYTHVPLYPEEQHICPPISPDVLLALPTVCPPFFKLNVQLPDYDTSLIRIDGLEVMQLRMVVPPDVEFAAEVEAPGFARDADGDIFESGDILRKRALVQPDWIRGQKRITIKAVLPGDEGQAVLRVYAGKKGLMHSSRDIPHPLALALPILHTGENPSYDFVLRHPTPHAQRHDLYIMQPQCSRLAVNNTFVFAVRQHPAAPASTKDETSNGRGSPVSVFTRPSSALSMVSSTAGGSTVSGASNEFSASTSVISSTRSASGRDKAAKLAIQSPSGKILRLTRKAEHMISNDTGTESVTDAVAEGSVWETVIKIGERGMWRGLVLADRAARWCVFCEWECV